jgi:hypothetical protein
MNFELLYWVSLEIREYGRRDLSHWPHGTLYPQKLALTSPTSGGRSVGIVRHGVFTYECIYIEWLQINKKAQNHWLCELRPSSEF